MKLITVETVENVEGIGPVGFHKFNRVSYATRTHTQRFEFEANGREYWGEIVRRYDRLDRTGERVTYDVELMTRNSRTGLGQSIPWNAKQDWRLALRLAFKAHLEQFLAAEEAAARAAAETLEEVPADCLNCGAPALEQKLCPACRKVESIRIEYEETAEVPAVADIPVVERVDLTPTWTAVVPILAMALESGTEEGRKAARAELKEMARAADRWNAATQVQPVAIVPDPDALETSFLISGNGWSA
jgi:hypothetical protein